MLALFVKFPCAKIQVSRRGRGEEGRGRGGGGGGRRGGGGGEERSFN